MTAEELHGLVAESRGNESNICQICAMKGGRTVYEDCWRGFQPHDAVNAMSVTKGVMALLIGIAIDRGFIGGTDRKVLDFFPGYRVKRGEKTASAVTIRHLLTMTAPWKYRSEPWKKVCTSCDWTLAALDLLGGRGGLAGGFRYSTLGLQVLSGVLEAATGRSCLDFANECLFAPLGIPAHALHGDSSKEDQFAFLMDRGPRANEWYADPKGTVCAGWGLTLSARAMARIGALCLDGGAFAGKRVVSAAWIREMTSPHLRLGEAFGSMAYGFLWYRPDPAREAFAAIGDGGNVIYADPATGVAVGVTGWFKPRIFDRVAFIEKCVVPLALELSGGKHGI